MNQISNDEIDLIEILKKLYNSKKQIILVSLVFGLIGCVIALTSPISYNSSTVFIPQNQENMKSSTLSGVASLVGININSSTSEIPPSMYPQISESPKFKRMLLQSIIDQDNNLTLADYIDIDGSLNNYKKSENLNSIYVSEIEEYFFEKISKIINISVNQKDGFITINSTMPVANYSAVVANNSKEILQKIIIENKIESAKQILEFSLNQLNEKKKEFNSIQSKLAYFKDSNLNLVNTLSINEQSRLESEFEIINSVVTELSKQVEQAKLQVSKDTPVFSTIKEAVIPNYRDSPKRTQIVIIYTLIGFIISTIFFLINRPIYQIIQEVVKSKDL